MNLKSYIALLSADAGDADQLARRFKSLVSSERRHHAQAMFRILANRRYASDLNVRIGAINVLLALPQESLPILWKLVRGGATPISCEVAFTLFLLLSFGSPRFKRKYIHMGESYLMHTKSNMGSAAFEAAHYLGSSCNDWAGVESLFRVIRHGKSLVGRTEALQRLAYALRRQNNHRRRRILNFLKARTRDPNKQVRWHSEFVLKYAESL